MTQKKQVLHSDGTQDAFRPDIIRQYLIQETEIDENLREKIVQSISRKVNGLESDLITTVQLRAEVTSRLTSENIEEEPFVIVTESDIMSLLLDYDRNNANQVRSAGALEYSLFEMVAKRYMTTQYSPEWREAVQYGLVYPHDAAQEVYKGLNCFILDPTFIFKKGLRTYGDNGLGAVSAPPKHFDTALELIEQTLGLATSYIAGGVCCASFSTFLAPFIVGMDDKDIKQALQGFLFQCNQAFKNRGSQSMFSSVVLDLEVPEFLLDAEAIGPGGQVVGTYADYQDEAKKIIRILTEVAIEGDAEGKALFFPNLIYNIDYADLNEWPEIFDLSAKFSSPYFCSAHSNGVEYQSTLGCRSAMPSNWSGDPRRDCMGTGNAVYTTISLPAVALKAQEENVDFFDLLADTMELVHQYNANRLDWIKKLWYDYKVADFMIQEDEDGVPMYRLEDATMVCGYLGLSEALEILGYGPIYECNDKAREIMIFMRDTVARWKKEDGLRYGLFQTPAESATLKLSQKMIKRFGFKKSHAKGTKEASFYTNSNHVPVDADIDLIDRIKIEGGNQPLGAAGNIMNVYLGESYSEGSALKVLCEKIRDETDAYFWAFTGDYSICPKCHSKFKGAIDVCPNCGSHTNTISRVTGYQTVVETWNPGKQSEFKVRKRY